MVVETRKLNESVSLQDCPIKTFFEKEEEETEIELLQGINIVNALSFLEKPAKKLDNFVLERLQGNNIVVFLDELAFFE